MQWDDSYDFVIVGSGAASIIAALVAKDAGKRPLILEKQAKFGGSTSFSGGVLWIPGNYTMAHDDLDQARQYMDALIGEAGPASSPERRAAYLREGPRALLYLRDKGMKFVEANWPDYYHGLAPGGVPRGRSVICPLFDVDEIGEWGNKLGRFEGWPWLPIASEEMAPLTSAKTNWKGRKVALRLGWRMLREKLTGKRYRGSGNALQGRLLQIALREKIPIWMESELIDLETEGERIAGVRIRREGREMHVEARDGVLLNTGGFSHNKEMRQQYQLSPASTAWTASNPGDTGDGIQIGMRHGGAIALMDQSWWTPGSVKPSGEIAGFHLPGDAAKPHMIVVDKNGKRFLNEGNSYMESGRLMYEHGAVPAYGILDSQHRSKYALGMFAPGITPKEEIESGYLKRADTIDDLARQIGVDPAGLKATVERWNEFSRNGRDLDFHAGETEYNLYMGDPAQKPNPSLGTIEKAPFYAVEIWPNDVGTSGGLLTNEHGQVVREDGSLIEGLYAAGNCSASVMGKVYPGAGSSIAPALIFGFIAAMHATRSNAPAAGVPELVA